MTNATEPTCHEYRIEGLGVVELPGAVLHGRDWMVCRDLDTIVIRVGMFEQERRRALAEALTEMVEQDQAPDGDVAGDHDIVICTREGLLYGRTYLWQGTSLLEIEGTLTAAQQRQAIDDAFAELRDKALARALKA